MFDVRNIIKVTTACFVLTVVISTNAFSLDNLLINGDFEDTTGWGAAGTTDFPVGWAAYKDPRKNPTNQQNAAASMDPIGGSGTSAYLPAFYSGDEETRRDMVNVLSTPSSEFFHYDFDFASEDPGDEGDRSLTGAIYTTSSSILFRVVDLYDDGVGDLQMYQQPDPNSGWNTVLENVITFDSDVTVAPVVNHFSLTGHYDGTNAYYDVTVTNANSQAFTATGLTYSNRTITPGSVVTQVTFNTFNSLGDYTIDNVELANEELVRPDQYITNGDFENTTGWGVAGTTFPPYGWTMEGIRTSAADQRSGTLAIGGSGTSAYMEPFKTSVEADRREIRQTFDVPTSNDWQLDLDLAAETTSATDERSFTLELVDYEGGKIFARIVDHDQNGIGDLEIYSNSAWQTVTGLENAIVLDDVLGADPSVNHLTIIGRYGEDTPFYDVLITDANDVEYSATGLSLWASAAPTGGFGGLQGVAFNTFNSDEPYMIDNVSLVDIAPLNAGIPGDTDGDNDVDEDDARVLASRWGENVGTAGAAAGDFNNDGWANAIDASILAANWTGSLTENADESPVPEPSAIILCAMGVLVWLGGRRIS